MTFGPTHFSFIWCVYDTTEGVNFLSIPWLQNPDTTLNETYEDEEEEDGLDEEDDDDEDPVS